KYDDTLPLTEQKLVKYLRKVSRVFFERIIEDQWEKHEDAVVHYVNLKASIDDYYNENIAHIDQIDKLMEASMSSLKKRNTTINDLYKGLEVITQLLKDITNSVKDDPATNKKIKKASETLAKISTQTTKILSSVRSFDFSTLQISGLERAQTHIESSMSYLKEDTSSIKSMMTEMYNAFRGQSSSAPSSTEETDANIQEKPEEPKQSIDANIKFIGSSTHPPSITQAQPITIIHPEPYVPQIEGKGTATDDRAKDQRKLVKASSIVRPNLDELVRVKFMINGKIVYLTEQEIQEYWDK
nr:hypothetical protein [Tanacetum cinerariifolium]